MVPAQLKVRGTLQLIVKAGEHGIRSADITLARALQQLGYRNLIHASLAGYATRHDGAPRRLPLLPEGRSPCDPVHR